MRGELTLSDEDKITFADTDPFLLIALLTCNLNVASCGEGRPRRTAKLKV